MMIVNNRIDLSVWSRQKDTVCCIHSDSAFTEKESGQAGNKILGLPEGNGGSDV